MKSIVLLLFAITMGSGLGAYCQDPVILTVDQPLPLQADAGTDIEISKGDSAIIGGIPSALDGYGDYVFLWEPSVGLNDPTWPNPTATPDITTTYQLTVLDANNCTAISEVTISVDASGIGLDPAELLFRCYPNPVEDELIIEMTGMPALVKIRLFNTMGTELIFLERKMFGNEAVERISTNNLPVGIYYLQLITEGKTFYQSLIKTR